MATTTTATKQLIQRLRICQRCLEEDKEIPKETADAIWDAWHKSKPTDRNIAFLLIAVCMTLERLRDSISYKFWDVQQALSIPGRTEFNCILSRIAPLLVQCWPSRVLGTDGIAEDPEDPDLFFIVPGVNLTEYAAELRLRQLQELLCVHHWDRPRETFLRPPIPPAEPFHPLPPPGWVQRWSDTFANEKKSERFESDVEELHSRMKPLFGNDLKSICRKLVGLNPLTKRLVGWTLTAPDPPRLHLGTIPDPSFPIPSIVFVHSTGLFLVSNGGLYQEPTHAVEELLQRNKRCAPLTSFHGDAALPEIMGEKRKVKESMWAIKAWKSEAISSRPQLLAELGAEYAGVDLADDGDEVAPNDDEMATTMEVE